VMVRQEHIQSQHIIIHRAECQQKQRT
jgi:hypothetical protein